ncbi:MAG: hypothetical protein JWO52_5353 [Gammaproteobacteria bacterium]|jgi:hypothetical protein|nr:hypothetical protein [Gammaproteobacteria bacterium]
MRSRLESLTSGFESLALCKRHAEKAESFICRNGRSDGLGRELHRCHFTRTRIGSAETAQSDSSGPFR